MSLSTDVRLFRNDSPCVVTEVVQGSADSIIYTLKQNVWREAPSHNFIIHTPCPKAHSECSDSHKNNPIICPPDRNLLFCILIVGGSDGTVVRFFGRGDAVVEVLDEAERLAVLVDKSQGVGRWAHAQQLKQKKKCEKHKEKTLSDQRRPLFAQ